MTSSKDMRKNIKIAKNLIESSPTFKDVLKLIVFHNNGNVDKKF